MEGGWPGEGNQRADPLAEVPNDPPLSHPSSPTPRSSPSAEKEHEAISSGMDIYQTKPAPAEALVQTIVNFRQQGSS